MFESACLKPRIDQNNLLGLSELFVPLQTRRKIAETMATSHLQGDPMSSLSSSAQYHEQLLLWTLR
jgi:hypothetical protein